MQGEKQELPSQISGKSCENFRGQTFGLNVFFYILFEEAETWSCRLQIKTWLLGMENQVEGPNFISL